jgi:hypothetical protein
MMRRLALALVLIASASSAAAQSVGVGSAFSKGRIHVGATVSTGYAFDESYFVLGLGASYYLLDGLSVGVFVESWSGSDPGLIKYTASTQYVFYRMQTVKPYVGAFYRRTDIENLRDLDSAGARGGIYVQAAQNAYIGLGAVYEKYLDCEKGIYRTCDSTYAEVTFTLAF